MADIRIDPHLGTMVHVVCSRQRRPNLPVSGCPFCVGGREAPDPYDVRWFPNRWPAMAGDRCDVVLYTADHDATFWSLDVDYVLAFENRGSEVGATIAHPHGQIYAYDHVPSRQARRLEARWCPDPAPRDRSIVEPYMMWLNQRPTTSQGFDDAWFNIEIASPWRSAGVSRYIAAADVACGSTSIPWSQGSWLSGCARSAEIRHDVRRKGRQRCCQ